MKEAKLEDYENPSVMGYGNKLVKFSPIYFEDVQKQICMIIEHCGDYLPNIDVKWFIKDYMKSQHRKWVEHGLPKHMMQYGDVVIIQQYVDKKVDYPKSNIHPDCYFNFGFWVALIGNYMSFKYDIPLADLIDLITVDDFERQYPARHEEGLELASTKLYNRYIKDNYPSIDGNK